MNTFAAPEPADRIVSVEMFEHMRNYAVLFERVASWLEPHGRFFMHVFCHRSTPYEFVDAGAADWMSRYFFSGGIMPSDDLPLRFQRPPCARATLALGRHVTTSKTANAWLANFDARQRHGAARARSGVRQRERRAVAAALAHVLHGVRRAVRLCQRPGVVRESLPVRATRAP